MGVHILIEQPEVSSHQAVVHGPHGVRENDFIHVPAAALFLCVRSPRSVITLEPCTLDS